MFKRFLGPNRPHLWDRQFEDIMGAKVIMAIASLEERAQVARDQSQKRLINEGQPVCTPTHSQRWPVGSFIEVTMMGKPLTTCHKAQCAMVHSVERAQTLDRGIHIQTITIIE